MRAERVADLDFRRFVAMTAGQDKGAARPGPKA